MNTPVPTSLRNLATADHDDAIGDRRRMTTVTLAAIAAVQAA